MNIRGILSFCFLCFFLTGVGAEVIILTSDQQLYDLMDPDKKIDMSLGHQSVFRSLREVCESAQENGHEELVIAFDEFFRQYRPQAGTERLLTPDMDEYIEMIKFISDFAKDYGLGLGLSLLSPLELGPAYKKQTGEAGRWLHYKTGLRNSSDGKFSIPIWQQLFWTNNKGKFRLKLKGVKAFAFKEKSAKSSPHIAVDPDDIIEIEGVKYEAGDTVDVGSDIFGIQQSPEDMVFPARNLRVYYDGPKQLEGYDRVFVLLEYETPELDYFSDKAPQFLKELVEKYDDYGVNLTSLYSDEMHIQQDWVYFSHHEGGQFATRFLTESFSDQYEEKYDQRLDDKYMLYFAYGAPYYLATAASVRNIQYVMGAEPEDIHRTFLLRDRYYRMLNDGVVDLFKEAKDHAEDLYDRHLPTGAHASWAQSPTIDLWDAEKLHGNAYKYEYTSNFIWSNTVHQAAAACYDYFKWGEYLVPTGNDFAEGGWADRNYYGAAMGASIGVVNQTRNAYAAAWGFPQEGLHWKNMLNEAYGAQPSKTMKLMTENVHRDVEVLIVYPMNLVAVEERFGSWMTQYGYANYLTSDKLVEMGEILPDGQIRVADKKYSTVVSLFEPLPEVGLMEMLDEFVMGGGNLVWCSAPPLLDQDGTFCYDKWQSLLGVEYQHDEYMGEIASGKRIEFENSLSQVPDQVILTDFLVDRIYPVKNLSSAETIAKVEEKIVGTKHQKGEGFAYFFGFRPRDDQSQSLGYESRTLFEILSEIGAYPSTGVFDENDNPTYVSRTTDFLATKFPNGTTALVKHYRTHRENWEGGFSRDAEADQKALSENPLPSDRLDIEDLKVNGNEISYTGKMNMAYRVDENNHLVAFNGRECTGITIDGNTYNFSDHPVDVAFVPEDDAFDSYQMKIGGEGNVQIPVPSGKTDAIVKMGVNEIESIIEDEYLLIPIDEKLSGEWLNVRFY